MRWAVICPAIVFVASLALYWATLAPSATGGDSGEFQFVPYVLGIPHHTGYPLYTLLGKLWSYLPLGTVAYRMNLLSAVLGAGAVAATYLLGRELTHSRTAALVGAAVLACSPLFWLWSTIAGVRSASALLPAVVLWLAMRWDGRVPGKANGADAEDAGPGRIPVVRGDIGLVALAFASGIALAHHRSAIYLAPALLPFLLLVDWRVFGRLRTILVSLAAFAVPLLSYLYLPWRSRAGAPFDQFHPDSWQGFWDLVLAVPLSRSFFSVPASEMGARLGTALNTLSGEFLPAGVALAGAGALALAVRRPKALVPLIIFLAASVVQTMAWNIGQRLNVVYLLPAFPVVAALAAAGVDGLARLGASLALRLSALLGRDGRPMLIRIALSLLISAVALAAVIRGGLDVAGAASVAAVQPLDKFRSDLSRGLAGQRLALSSLPYLEPDALVIGYWEQVTPFWYYQMIDGINPSVEMSYALDDLDKLLAENRDRPIYLALASSKAAGKRLTMVGPLAKVVDAPATTVPDGVPTAGVRLDNGLDLAGVAFFDAWGRRHPAPPSGADVVAVQVYWRAERRLDGDYSVSLRLVGDDGAVAAQQDSQHPVLGLYPTSRWAAGEAIGDYYELPRRSLAPGTYRLQVVVYRRLADGFRNARVLSADGTPGGETIDLAEGIPGG